MVDEIVDLFKLNIDEYIAPVSPRIVRNLQASYLMISGTCEFSSDIFSQKQKMLLQVAEALKRAWQDAGQDFVVSKLEILWWIPVENGDIFAAPPEDWQWRQIIRIPYFVQPEDVEEIIEELASKSTDHALAKEVFLEPLKEGLCVQMKHEGSFESEVSTMGTMKRFAEKEGFHFDGLHHQIYLSDPSDSNPDTRHVILRRRIAG